jgi:preprotein translocase subunit SecG
MDIIFSSIIILASVLLILVVYIQNPKGGGLSSDFGAAQQLGGVQKTNDFIDKATWTLAGVIMICSIVLTINSKTTDQSAKPQMQQEQGQQGQQGQQTQGQPQGQGQQAPQGK